MSLRRRVYAAVGFGYLGSVAILVAALVAVGCLLDRVRRSSRYDAALVTVIVRLLRPVDLIPAGPAPSPAAAESVPPADEPA